MQNENVYVFGCQSIIDEKMSYYNDEKIIELEVSGDTTYILIDRSERYVALMLKSIILYDDT